jgi:hypothetical protein
MAGGLHLPQLHPILTPNIQAKTSNFGQVTQEEIFLT